MWTGVDEGRPTSCDPLVFLAFASACIFCYGPILYVLLLAHIILCFWADWGQQSIVFQFLCQCGIGNITYNFMCTRFEGSNPSHGLIIVPKTYFPAPGFFQTRRDAFKCIWGVVCLDFACEIK